MNALVANTAMLDLDNISLDELDNLSINDILGEDLSEISLSSNLPDGTYVFTVDSYEVKSFAPDHEKERKARRVVNVKLKVATALSVADPNVDRAALNGRMHFERYDLLSEFGRQSFVKLLLGIIGIKFTDKAAIKQVGQNPGTLLETIKSEKLPFGGQVKTVERNGFENCNLMLKEASFIPADKVQELLD